VQRHPANPIVTPGRYPWRAAVTFNPGAIEHDGRVYLLERAAGSLRPFQCAVGLLVSDDGVHFEHVSDQPVFTPQQLGAPEGTIEDPRVVRIDGLFYLVFAFRPHTYCCHPTGVGVPQYTAAVGELDRGVNFTRSGLAVSSDLRQWRFLGFTTPPDVDDRDNVLFPEKIAGRFALLRRPREFVGPRYECSGPGIWLSTSHDGVIWSSPELVAQPGQTWDSAKIGAAGPPIATEHGWLVFYHGVDERDIYRLGALLLDRDDPTRVLARGRDFLMEPATYYERFGLVIPNVIFPTANVVRGRKVWLYYGCCDTSIALATVGLDEVLRWMLS
jgi:predicted GH43/DUF377 family glycosyl hydrolase